MTLLDVGELLCFFFGSDNRFFVEVYLSGGDENISRKSSSVAELEAS